MNLRFLRKSISFAVAIVLVTQPAINAYSQTSPGNLAPDPVSAEKHMTEEAELSSQSIVSDAQFLSFAAFVYKAVLLEGKDAEALFDGLRTISFWGVPDLRKHLSQNFVGVTGDRLSIKFRDGGVLRVVPAGNYKVSGDGDIGDGMKPDKYFGTDEHVFQYFPGPAPEGKMDLWTDDPASDEGSLPENGKTMIPFGPLVSYSALRISPDTRGIYISVELYRGKDGRMHDRLACRAAEGASQKAAAVAAMIDQVLGLMDLKSLNRRKGEDRYLDHVCNRFDAIKRHLRGSRVVVETAYNLMANSEIYDNTLVFNDYFLNAIYRMWKEHRDNTGAENWQMEVGAIWMLVERLYHDLGHKATEEEQILEDRHFYIAIVGKYDFVKAGIKGNASMNVPAGASDEKRPFGEAFGSNDYFRMIHRIAAMDKREQKSAAVAEIKSYMRETLRKNSSRESLGLTEEQISDAGKILRDHGIRDDLFGETILGKGFSDFLKTHCLFTHFAPYKNDEIERRRKAWSNSLRNRRIRNEIVPRLLEIGRSIGKEAETRRWIDIRLKTTDLTGKGSVRRKLYPVIEWASRVANPQNYELRRGKLFGRVDYEGLNLMTLPIFPLDGNGEIDWELFAWAYKGPRETAGVRGPPMDYFNSKRVSLYEYIITRNPADGRKPGEYVQMPLFDNVAQEEDPGISGEKTLSSIDQADADSESQKGQSTIFDLGLDSEEIAKVRQQIVRVDGIMRDIDVTPTVGKVTHILIDKDIPAHSQQEIIRSLNARSDDPHIAEKIFFLDKKAINGYIAANGCGRENTVVIVGSEGGMAAVSGDVNLLVAEKDGITDFVNVQGLVAAARSLLNKDWDSFRDVYREMTGKECPQIRPEWLSDPAALARGLAMMLPRVSITDVNELIKLNETLKAALVSA